MFVCYKAISV